jgi:predicted metal-dependent peptidase
MEPMQLGSVRPFFELVEKKELWWCHQIQFTDGKTPVSN